MSNQIELSFKNKAVRMWLYLMVPTVLLQFGLTRLTEIPRIIPAVLPVIPLVIFFVWMTLYKRNGK